MARGNPNSLKMRSNTLKANISLVASASQASRYRLAESVTVRG